MTFEKIGIIAELIAAISVFITLLYLAKQIKDNSKLLTTSVYQTAMDGYNEMASLFLENQKIAMVLLVGSKTELSQEESFRLNILLRVYMNQNFKLFRLYEEGVFPEKDWILRAGETKQIIENTEHGREFVKNNLIFIDMWKNLEKIEIQETSKFN